MADIIVTLIHGTFAKNAAWTLGTSQFCQSIADGSEAKVRFEQFHWSARNKIYDRLSSVEKLTDTLADQRRAYPDCPQVVIGHSHGGSILALALKRHPAMAQQISAVFLATPFIDARPRSNWVAVATVTSVASLFLLAAAMSGVLMVAMLGAASAGYLILTWLIFALWFASYLVAAGLVFFLVGWNAFSRFDPEKLAQDLSTCDLPTGRYLFIRTTGDEANNILSAAQFSSWLVAKFVSIFIRPWPFPKGRTSQLVIGSIAAFVIVLAPWPGFIRAFKYLEDPQNAQAWPPGFWSKAAAVWAYIVSFLSELVSFTSTAFHEAWMFGLIVSAAVIVFVGTTLLSVVLILFFIICLLCHRSFGRWSLQTAMLIELVVEAVPLGFHTLLHTSWPETDSVWSHSSPYNDREAISAICEFMRPLPGKGIAP